MTHCHRQTLASPSPPSLSLFLLQDHCRSAAERLSVFCLRREAERDEVVAAAGRRGGGAVARWWRHDGVVVGGRGGGPDAGPFSELGQGGAPGVQPRAGLQLLPEELPQRGLHRPQRHLGAGRRQPGTPRPPPPPPLPRLLRQGVRRVDPAGQRAEREDGGAEPVRGRLRGDRRHQDAAGAGVPGRRLLRRHRRARRPRRRLLPVQGLAVAGRDGPPRRHRVAGVQHWRAPVPVRRLQRPPPELLRARAQPHRPRRALRRPHHRRRQLLQRHPAALQRERHQRRPAPRLRLRQDAHGLVPVLVGVRHRQPRRRHGGQVRQRLLHQRAQQAGHAGVRRRAHAERRRRADGAGPHQPHQVLRRLLHVHEEDGPRRGAHRRQRPDQEAVPPGQQLVIGRRPASSLSLHNMIPFDSSLACLPPFPPLSLSLQRSATARINIFRPAPVIDLDQLDPPKICWICYVLECLAKCKKKN